MEQRVENFLFFLFSNSKDPLICTRGSAMIERAPSALGPNSARPGEPANNSRIDQAICDDFIDFIFRIPGIFNAA